MSEAQAQEVDNEIIVEGEVSEETTEEAVVEAQADPEEQEIVVEDEGQPPRRRVTGFEKRLRKKDEKYDDLEGRFKAVQQENELLRLNMQQKPKEVQEPNEDDFDDPKEYRAALKEWVVSEATKASSNNAQELLKKSQANMTQGQIDSRQKAAVEDHYRRADDLKVRNYDELEGKGIDIIGTDMAQLLMSTTDKSHLILPYLGANPGKAQEIADLANSGDPLKASQAFALAVSYGNKTILKPKSTAPDPEEVVDPGAGVSGKEPNWPTGAKIW